MNTKKRPHLITFDRKRNTFLCNGGDIDLDEANTHWINADAEWSQSAYLRMAKLQLAGITKNLP